MLQPNDLPLLCLPVDLSDEAAAKFVEFLHELTAAMERHYCAQLLRYYHPTDIAQCDRDSGTAHPSTVLISRSSADTRHRAPLDLGQFRASPPK